jgi:hypothetical protein
LPGAVVADPAPTPAPTVQTVRSGVQLDPEVQRVLDRMRAGQAHDATQAARVVPTAIEPVKQNQSVLPAAERGPER